MKCSFASGSEGGECLRKNGCGDLLGSPHFFQEEFSEPGSIGGGEQRLRKNNRYMRYSAGSGKPGLAGRRF